MTDYITVQDVDNQFGTGWEGTGDKDQAVLEANIWLTARKLPKDDPVDPDIVLAGAYLAREAANERLYNEAVGAIKRKRVKAEGVETEKEYENGDNRRSGAMRLINDLLRPWVSSGSQFAVRPG